MYLQVTKIKQKNEGYKKNKRTIRQILIFDLELSLQGHSYDTRYLYPSA